MVKCEARIVVLALVIEKTFSRISHVFQRMRIRVGMGGLGPGAGLTIGSDFDRL